MSEMCEHETFKDICTVCHRDGVIDKLKAANLHQTSAKILEQAARIEQLEAALRDVHAAAGNNHLIANIARAALKEKA